MSAQKKTALCLLLLLSCLLFLWAGCTREIPHAEYIRLHVRADSNESEAQELKLKVRDAVVAYLTIQAKRVTDRDEMERLIQKELPHITEIADEVLQEEGAPYRAVARLAVENFPERSYGDLVLEEGEYQALILELGSGKGDNWWCVAYPPLCFIAAEENGDDEIRYRSYIADFFKSLG